MVTADIRVRPAPNVFAREFDGELVIVDLERGDYYGLNEVGGSAWEALCAGQSPREIAGVLEAEYDARREILEADLTRLVQDLLDHRLVIVTAQ